MNVTPSDPNKIKYPKTPPMTYADVVFRNIQKPPKEILS